MTLAAKLDTWLEQQRREGCQVFVYSTQEAWHCELFYPQSRRIHGKGDTQPGAKLNARLIRERIRKGLAA